MRTLAASLVSLVVLLTLPEEAVSQSVLAGGVAGLVESRQIRERAEDSETRAGFLVGAWADIPTPTRPLHVLAEIAYVRRGGTFALGGPSGTVGDVEADYLATTVSPLLRFGADAVGVFVYAGLTFEAPLRTRIAPGLAAAYSEPSDQSISATAGAGLEWQSSRWVVRGEGRIVEGLSAAYANAAGDYRHRSFELLLRVGKSGLRRRG